MENSDKRIYRLPGKGIVGGVCAGLAEYFSVDPTLVRAFFIFLTFMGGAGLYLYVVLWLILPQSDADQPDNKEILSIKSGNRKIVLGSILLAVGLISLINEVAPAFIRWDLFWPVILILAGILLVFRR